MRPLKIPAGVDFPALYLDGTRVFVIRKVLGRELEKEGLCYWAAKESVSLTDGKQVWIKRLEVFRAKDNLTSLHALSASMSPPLPYSDISHRLNGFNTRITSPRGKHYKNTSKSAYTELLDAFVSGSRRARKIFGAWKKKAAPVVKAKRDPQEGRAVIYLPER